MIENNLPQTPFHVLNISSSLNRLKLDITVRSAELFGYWKYPYKEAASAAEDMTLKDAHYWVYKSKNPITIAEKGVKELLAENKKAPTLPEDFLETNKLTFGACGDLLWSDELTYSKDFLFRNISDLLFNQDISYANFESPVTTQELKKEIIGDSGPPYECCSTEHFDILKGYKNLHFKVLNIANNHIFDMGLEGIETTVKTLSDRDIFTIGVNEKITEYGQGKTLVTNGIKIGFVSATFGLNGRILPENDNYRVNIAKGLTGMHASNADLIKAQIADCKRQNCDFIIASLHWGHEFEFFPRKWQIDLAHTLVEWGADAIIGHHPHVVQPVEYYRTKRDPDRVAVIAYSLGSLTWGFTAPHLVLSAILNLEISKGFFEGKDITYIKSARVTPVFRKHVSWQNKILTELQELPFNSDDINLSAYTTKIKEYADLVL